jgi:hypothetical protein
MGCVNSKETMAKEDPSPKAASSPAKDQDMKPSGKMDKNATEPIDSSGDLLFYLYAHYDFLY